MKIYAIVLIIFIRESSSSYETSILEEEAVFQGNCKRENLCSQLCYELHDGMFECACKAGFELDEDGYSCSKTKNISLISSSSSSSLSTATTSNNNESESKVDDDYTSSDVFYQKGVSFSAKLDDSEIYETSNNLTSSSIVDTLPDNHTTKDNRKSFEYNKKTEPTTTNNNETFVITTTMSVDNFNIPKFYQTSYLAFHPLKGANLVTEIVIDFRPEDLNGTLLFSGERDDMTGDFMIVSLNDGFVEFLFNCGSGEGKIRSSERVILYEWNTLTIYRYKWEGWIELNERRRKRGRSTGIFSRITFRSLLYIGGMGNETRDSLKNTPTALGFSGCIRKFLINGKSYIQYDTSNFTQPTIVASSNLSECLNDECSYMRCLHGGRCQKRIEGYFCLCSLGWSGKFCEDKVNLEVPLFNGSSYLRYSPLDESAIIWLEIKMTIKPKSLDGLLLFSGQHDIGDFISLHLNFGYIEFNFDLGSGSTSVKSKYPISLNEWHTIRISRTARLAVLKVDSQPEIMNVSPNGFWHLSLPYSLFLGGVSKQNLLPSNLRDLGTFKGCVQELEINNRKIELIDEALGGFNVANCDDENCNPQLSQIVTTTTTTPTTHNSNDDDEYDGGGGDDDHHEEGKIDYKFIKNNQKYAFDVIDDGNEVQTYDNFTTTVVNSLDYNSNNNNNNNINLNNNNKYYDDAPPAPKKHQKQQQHKKIVRVSLHHSSSSSSSKNVVDKNDGRLKEICFKKNIQNYTFYGFNNSIKYESLYQQINVNIRFKTSHENGLLLLVNQMDHDNMENIFLSLSIEDGFMRLKYNFKNTFIDIKNDISNVNDGLWHRVQASRKKLRGSLTIDNLKSISHRTKIKQFAINGTPGIYIGGSFFTHNLPRHFDGCISDFSISTGNEKHHLDLQKNNNNNNYMVRRKKESNSNVNLHDDLMMSS